MICYHIPAAPPGWLTRASVVSAFDGWAAPEAAGAIAGAGEAPILLISIEI